MNRLRLLILLIMMITTLAACGASQTTTTPSTDSPTSAPVPTDAPTTADAPAATEPAATEPADAAPVTNDTVDRSRLDTELFLYNWGDYIDEDILTDFETEYGVTVNLESYDTNEDMLAKIRPGNSGYDVIVPSDYAVDILIKEGLVAKLDKANLPNISNLDPNYMNLYYDPGNEYSVPYFVGLTGIAYNKKVVTTPPDSWAVLFDPAQLEPYSGKASMLDDEREAIGAALVYMGLSINDTDPANLAKAEEMLKAQKPLLAAYNSSDFNRKLASEEVVLAQAWNGGAGQAYTGLDDFPGNPDIGFVIPKEGGTIWQDNMMIVGDTTRKYTAEVFLNYMLDPTVAAKNADYVLYGTPNLEAAKLIAPETQAVYDAGFGPPDAEQVKRLQWIKRSDADNTIFSDVWTRVKSS